VPAHELNTVLTASHLLVANPTAQSGKNEARIERARVLLREHGIQCDFLPTEPEGRTIDAVRDAVNAGEYQVVIAQGGDGTFREVGAGILTSLRPREVALGMLPTGTANDQARSFGLSAGDDALPRNVRVVAEGCETQLDAGLLTAMDQAGTVQRRDYFFDSAGWGISARILAARNADRKIIEHLKPLKAIYRDQLVYAGAALRVFLESYVVTDNFDVTGECDGRPIALSGLTDLIIKGTRIYAGAWVFDRDSLHDDGQFEVVPFRGKRDWTSKALVDLKGNPVTEELLNSIGIEHTKPFRAARLAITFEQDPKAVPVAAQIDGEEYPATERVGLEVQKRALRLIVPEAALYRG
jgi:diacylglycerol kinase family enzyme